MKYRLLSYLFISCLCYSFTSATAQDVQIKLGESKITSDGSFNIAVTVRNGSMAITSPFPEISGFQKGNRSISQSQAMSFDGTKSVVSTTSTTIQPYIPTKIGKFKLKPFTMTISGKKVRSPGKEITVVAADPNKKDPFNIIFGGDLKQKLELKNMDTSKDGAFLALSISKDEIFVGEGVLVRLAFYIPTSDKNKFHIRNDVNRISKQLEEIESKLKPAHCWEEDFGVSRLIEEREVINDKLYSRFKLMETMYFPLNSEEIVFPTVSLNMLKYNPSHARGQAFYGPEGYKTFYSGEKRIKVKELPPHPLKDVVNVGEYKLAEGINITETETGKSFQYSFQVEGVGNVGSIKEPTVPEQEKLIIYPGNVHQQVNKGRNTVYGARQFVYDIEAVDPGNYSMADYFQWVFFNPELAKYDTLRGTKEFVITGQSKKNIEIASNDLGEFYDGLIHENNTLQSTNATSWLKVAANTAIVVILLGLVVLVNQSKFLTKKT